MKESGDKKNSSLVGYIIGLVALVLAFFNPFPGLVLGIIGLVQSKKQKDALSKKAKKFNLIAIIVSIVLIILWMVINFVIIKENLLGSFPIA